MTDECLTFASADDFEAWLQAHHDTVGEVWVALPKKGTPVPSVTRAEALDVALCYGWIDGKSFSGNVPDGWWSQRFTPRRKRSTWSQINCARVEQLIAEGRMRPAGLAQIEAAKADGRWDRAYSPPSATTIPADLRAALDAAPAAAAAFDKLSRSRRFEIVFAVERAVRPETRARRIATHVAQLGAGEPHPGP
ncbi:YdeI/OmpD-associated family protein [Krasilnikovia sp. MM14-A1004]|uniref:YdeI/OmpD-associated family protein n=1 Tax=Krasilnikovia sp. MM14-A1004 TaxID=3373541 RepID=UPI00399C91AF